MQETNTKSVVFSVPIEPGDDFQLIKNGNFCNSCYFAFLERCVKDGNSKNLISKCENLKLSKTRVSFASNSPIFEKEIFTMNYKSSQMEKQKKQ